MSKLESHLVAEIRETAIRHALLLVGIGLILHASVQACGAFATPQQSWSTMSHFCLIRPLAAYRAANTNAVQVLQQALSVTTINCHLIVPLRRTKADTMFVWLVPVMFLFAQAELYDESTDYSK